MRCVDLDTLAPTSPSTARALATRKGALRAALIAEESERIALSCDDSEQERIADALNSLIAGADASIRDALTVAEQYFAAREDEIRERAQYEHMFNAHGALRRLYWSPVRGEILRAHGATERVPQKYNASPEGYEARQRTRDAREAALSGWMVEGSEPSSSVLKPAGRGVDTALALVAVQKFAAHPELLPATVRVASIVGALQRAEEASLALALPSAVDANEGAARRLSRMAAVRERHVKMLEDARADAAKSLTASGK